VAYVKEKNKKEKKPKQTRSRVKQRRGATACERDVEHLGEEDYESGGAVASGE